MNSEDDLIERQLAPRERAWLRGLRLAGWVLIAVYFLAAISLLAARYVLLPKLPEYRDDIAQLASEALGQRVTIDALQADWHGFHPRLELRGVTVHDAQDRPALRLPVVRVVVAWRSLAAREVRLRSLEIERAALDLHRSADGRLYVAGIELKPGPAGADSPADWVLRQDEIHVRDSSLVWRDDVRAAAPLQLQGVNFLLRNAGRTHEFALRAQPPAEYGSPIDLRGQLSGRSFAQLREWSGRLYASVDRLDVAAWQQWVDYPLELRAGRGAMRLWLSLAQRDVTEARAQVAFADVALRMAPQLPELELATLRGELGARRTRSGLSMLGLGNNEAGYEGWARELTLRTRAGLQLQPTEFTARWQGAGTEGTPTGDVKARLIELTPLAALGDYVPLPERFRKAITSVAPQGELHDVAFSWRGDIEAPATYTAKGRFAHLGMAPYHSLPGFDNLNGDFEFSESAGRVRTDNRRLAVHYPHLFAVERFEFDKLTARVNWTTARDGGVEVKLEDVLFDNADVSGTVSGVIRTTATGAHLADLTGRAARAHGPAVYKYIPDIPPELAQWLKQGILAGAASDIRFRLRGDLHDFPYRDPKRGEFRITGKVNGVNLRYDPEWPAIENIAGELSFNGPELSIRALHALSVGAQLEDVHARFADAYADEPTLRVQGAARGATNAFLKFVAQSPVREFIGGLTDGWTAEGAGQLDLNLDLPMHDLDATRVAGSYRFTENSIAMGPAEPPMTKATGRVDFTEKSASSPGITAQYLGGPLQVRVAQDAQGGVVTSASGSAEAAGLMRVASLPFADRVKGMTRYTARFVTRDGRTTSVFETGLQGVSVDMPEPFIKRAAENWPVRIERVDEGQGRQRVNATVGSLLGVQAALRKDGIRTVVDRAGVAIGNVAVPKPEGAFIALAANVARLNVDAMPSLDGTATPGGTSSNLPALGTIDLRAAELISAGRLIHDAKVQAQLRGQIWRGDIDSRELVGEIAWRPEGNGVIMARLRRLVHPESVEAAHGAASGYRKLPALDVVADRYVLDGRELGRLELQAFNEQGRWRIAHASLAAPGGTANISGFWQPRTVAAERTELDVKVEVQDIGTYLAPLGYRDMVRGGEGELTGHVTWNGPPTDLDYASLSGTVQVRAEDGQFVKLKPGVGRLLGVLSLQALPRRITLDFKDVFGEGFAFDRIDGTATITGGVMKTDNLGMIGPSASVVMTGTADLAHETQNLHVRVVPTVGDSVAAAAGLALLNPVVGVGVWVAQKLLKDPIGQIFAFEYSITGSWEDPQVEKLKAPQTKDGTSAAKD